MTALATSVRWHIKKAARRTCVAGSSLLGSDGTGIRALTYHRFALAPRDPFAVSPDDFARQMEWIAHRQLAVSLGEVLDHLGGSRLLRPGSVLVTIDDGFASTYHVALPILSRHEIPAVAFLPSALIGNAPAEDPEPRMTWSQVTELAAAGIEIGSHGRSHRSFGSMDAAEMDDEAGRSRRELEERSGSTVRAFAYPFGTRFDYGARSRQALRRAGYRCAFTAQHGRLDPGSPLELARVKIEGGDGWHAFVAACRGGLDRWRVVDRCLWALQARAA